MIIRKLIPNSFIAFLRLKLGSPSQKSAFIRLKKLGFVPHKVLDIGAYEGNWAEEFLSVFPETKIMMVEGQRNKEAILKNRIKAMPNAVLEIALLGAEEKKVEFNIYESASSVFTEDNETNAAVEILTLKLLDKVVENTPFEQIDFIKIDTQGYELEILKGGLKTLDSAQFVLLEVSLLGIYKNAPLVDEIMFFMKDKGFSLYDICSIMRRPYDNSLFQSDFLFIKTDHPLRSSTRWD